MDAGIYRGPGSYFVDGGAYRDSGSVGDIGPRGNPDARAIDASAGCAPLASCCPTLPGSSQSLCDDIATQGNAADCATELTQLQGEGECDGVTVLASQVQVAPVCMASDGTTLFWTTGSTPGMLAMPVGGGSITTVLSGPATGGGEVPGFCLAVDETNIYFLDVAGVVFRLPKNGSSAARVTEPGAQLTAVTALGSALYWLEGATYEDMGVFVKSTSVKSAPLPGGPITVVATFDAHDPIVGIGVTDGTLFIGENSQTTPLLDFPTSTGVPDGGPATMTPPESGLFTSVTSDANAVYWAQASGSNLSIGSDGTVTTLGPAVSSSNIVFDDTYVYWADMTTVGTIMRAPKTGGGATILARDTSPTGIAVDSVSVYWADQGGYIKSVPK